MPFYDYQCESCGTFSLQRSIAKRDHRAGCPVCRRSASRVIAAPNFSLMTSQRRDLHARNEKSRHEPAVTTKHRCGGGCGCGSTKVKSNRQIAVPKLGRFETPKKRNRPWMLGH